MIEEGETTCCYASSEKSWIDDPQGIQCEAFLTTAESSAHGMDEIRLGAEEEARPACCATTLLERTGLPTSDLESARPEFAVLRENGRVIAAGALQRFGSSALLRSVVVAPDRRGSGVGLTIVNELERMARAAQVSRVVLLTQTAAEFFARQGYRIIERSTAHPSGRMAGSLPLPSSRRTYPVLLVPLRAYPTHCP